MSRDEQLKHRWEEVVSKLSNQFADGDKLDLDAIIYLIGVQELGQLHRRFKKDHKLDLMHIAICKLLEPYGYYEFDFVDEDGWPHYKIKEQLPTLLFRNRLYTIFFLALPYRVRLSQVAIKDVLQQLLHP